MCNAEQSAVHKGDDDHLNHYDDDHHLNHYDDYDDDHLNHYDDHDDDHLNQYDDDHHLNHYDDDHHLNDDDDDGCIVEQCNAEQTTGHGGHMEVLVHCKVHLHPDLFNLIFC